MCIRYGAGAATVRGRVRAWGAVTRWLGWRRGKNWPTDAADVLDYVAEKMEDVPATSFPRAFGAALVWFESRAGIPADEKLSGMDLVKQFLESAGAAAESNSNEVTKAPRFSVAALVSMETLVMDEKAALALRVLAWSRLLKVYGGMRSDDMQRMRPDSIEVNEGGLVATLRRTKTTGPGKSTLQMKVYISVEAFAAQPNWLKVGYELWKAEAREDQDFLIARAKKDLTGFEAKVARKAIWPGCT